MAEKEKKQSVQTIQTKTRVEKGKSSIASVIFGRTGIIILLILLQFGFLTRDTRICRARCISSILS